MENVKVLLTGVKRYSFDDRDTGRRVEGTKAHYLQLDPVDDDNSYGYIPAVSTMPYEFFGKVKKMEMPQLCDAILTLHLSGSKPQVKVTDFIARGSYSFAE